MNERPWQGILRFSSAGEVQRHHDASSGCHLLSGENNEFFLRGGNSRPAFIRFIPSGVKAIGLDRAGVRNLGEPEFLWNHLTVFDPFGVSLRAAPGAGQN